MSEILEKISVFLMMLFFPALSFAQGCPEGLCPWHMGGGFGGGWFGLSVIGGIITLLIWVLIIVGIIYLLRGLFRKSWNGHGERERGYEEKREYHAPRDERYKDILKERYAKGEITKEQYDKMVDEIRRM